MVVEGLKHQKDERKAQYRDEGVLKYHFFVVDDDVVLIEEVADVHRQKYENHTVERLIGSLTRLSNCKLAIRNHKKIS